MAAGAPRIAVTLLEVVPRLLLSAETASRGVSGKRRLSLAGSTTASCLALLPALLLASVATRARTLSGSSS